MKPVIKMKAEGRLFFTTDIHGEIYTLIYGLKTLGFREGVDTLICAGDLCDRGRYNLDTISFFENDTTGSYLSVVGNHDAFTFQCNSDEAASLWVYNGGDWAFQAALAGEDDTEDSAMRSKVGHYLKSLPYAIEVEHEKRIYGVVHAAVPCEFGHWDAFVECLESGNKALRHHCVWDRDHVQYPDFAGHTLPVEGVDYVIHGHCVVKEPLFVGNRVHIDTGLVYGKYLTIAEVKEGEFTFHKFTKISKEGT